MEGTTEVQHSPGAVELDAAAARPHWPPPIIQLVDDIERDGGAVLAVYQEPVGENWQVLANLPLELVDPTPFQRDLTERHVERLVTAIEELQRFLDPVVAVRTEAGRYWCPNGCHRTEAVRRIRKTAITALVVPDRHVAYRILQLNTEKAHLLHERSLEVIRMARRLSLEEDPVEHDYASCFEAPELLTLGFAYERGRQFAGSCYQPVLRRLDAFMLLPLSQSLEVRDSWARRLLDLDEMVKAMVERLRRMRHRSPYLRQLVIARLDPIGRSGAPLPTVDDALERMIQRAGHLDVMKLSAQLSSG